MAKAKLAVDNNAAENLDNNVVEATLNIQNYEPTSDNCNTTGTVVPIGIRYEQMKAVETVDRRVNGVDEYILNKLQYKELGELCDMFSAEQVDSLAVAIYNLEQNKTGTIIGDGTGVGKGRQAAALIRYAHLNNIIPVFITEKPNLFSDIYRDLIDIKTDDGVVLKHLLSAKKQQKKRIDRKDVEALIVQNINDGEFELDYPVSLLQDSMNADSTAFTDAFRKTDTYSNVINEYIDQYFTAEFEEVDQYMPNKDYEKESKKANRLIPFVVNGRTPKTIIMDKAGNIIYEPKTELVTGVIQSGIFELYEDGDFVLATYSQFRSARPTQKKEWLKNIAHRCLFILDESHNAAGASNTGVYFSELVAASKGTIFLSATFAKRPDNMPIYAGKTSIGDANLTAEQLMSAFAKGGVALQEVVSGELTKEGQYIRRERSYEGVTVQYRTMDKSQETDYHMPQLNLEDLHTAYSDEITSIIRDIINLQTEFVDGVIEKMDEDIAASQGAIGIAKGDREMGIANSPAFSGVFNLINQVLMSINAGGTAELVLNELRNGRKPIVALANTMESFLDDVTMPGGQLAQAGDRISVNFKHVLARRLRNILRYREQNGSKVVTKYLDPEELGHAGYERYQLIYKKIEAVSVDLVFSPIDYIRKVVTEAGYTFKEVTGRDRMIDIHNDMTGTIVPRKKEPVNVLFREFNENITDCLLINQSGATGASAHAMTTGKVTIIPFDKAGNKVIPNSLEPRNEVKQRTMIILQAELDINFEVQKRGRVNRTGQVYPPKYIYVTSAIPAQQRLLMMLQKKLKSLDANSTGNQKQSTKVLDIADFLNKIGDDVVVDFLIKNPNINSLIGDPLKMEKDGQLVAEAAKETPDRANKVAGRVAILAVEMQKMFYETMAEMYAQEVERLKQMDEYDLEMEELNFKAKTLDRVVVQPGTGTNYFTRSVVMEKIEIDNLKKPFKKAEIETHIKNKLTITLEKGDTVVLTPQQYIEMLTDEMTSFYNARLKTTLLGLKQKFDDRLSKSKEAGIMLDARGKVIYDKPVGFGNMKPSKKETPTPLKFNKENADELESERRAAIAEDEILIERMIMRNKRLFEYFTPGQLYKFPTTDYDKTGNFQYAVFMGYKIPKKANNPYAASSIELEFAMDNSLKQLNIPSSKPEIDRAKSLTDSWFIENKAPEIWADWDHMIKESSANRVNRYILSGNLLKAFTAEAQLGEQFSGGRLVKFTLLDSPDKIKRGYLLPQSFSMVGKDIKTMNISVPIHYLNNYFADASNPKQQLRYRANEVLQIFVSANDITLDFKGGKAEYKDYIVDKTLQDLFSGSDWRISKGSATIAVSGIKTKNIIQYLWDQYKITISVSQAMAESMGIKTDADEYEDETIVVPDPIAVINNDFSQEEQRRKEVVQTEERDLTKTKRELKKVSIKLDIVQRKQAVENDLEQLIELLRSEAA